MGYYLQAPTNFNKADFLCSEYGGKIITVAEAETLMADPEAIAVVCVVNNGPFEAAAYCHSAAEFKEFSRPEDRRPKVWLRFDNVSAVRTAAGY